MIRTALLVLALALGGGAFHFGLLDGAAAIPSGMAAKAGGSYDPDGLAATGDVGGSADPNGASANSDAGGHFDPNG